MDVRINWVDPGGLVTDEYDVLYKVADPTNLNSWIIANPSPLPAGTTYYDITGLNPNTVYRFAVTKSCIGTTSLITQCSWYAIDCPIVSIYQGPPVFNSSYPTLFYSLYYPNSMHVAGASVNSFDAVISNTNDTCSPPNTTSASPVGRITYNTINTCLGGVNTSVYESCNTQGLDLYPTNSSLTSALGYYGLDGNSVCCNSNGSYNFALCSSYSQDTVIPAGQDPIIYAHKDFKFLIDTVIQDPSVSPPPFAGTGPTIVTILGDCHSDDIALNPEFTLAPVPADYTRITGAFCLNNCQAYISLRDGMNQTRLSDYTFAYQTRNSAGPTVTLPLVNSLGAPITTPDTTYSVYCPVAMTGFGALSTNIKYVFTVYNPGVTPVRTVTGTNFTGYTVQQIVQFIANDISANTPYTASRVNIGGTEYIKITPCTDLDRVDISLSQIFEVSPGNFVEVPIATCTGYIHDLIDMRVNGTGILVPQFINVNAPYVIDGYNFGQYKVTTQMPAPGNDVAYWTAMDTNTTGGVILANPYEVIEFAQFSYNEQLIRVENVTTSTVYDITDPTYLNAPSLPTFNTKNSIQFFAIQADYVNLNPNDLLLFTFANSVYPNCPFTTLQQVQF